MSSFSTALSALKAAATGIDAVGHNLANINTSGFKRSDVAFKDLMVGTGSNQTGGGIGRVLASRLFTQGPIAASGSPLDAAIQGGGFFVVRPSTTAAGTGSLAANQYTRDGHFQINSSGQLITANNGRVQGWALNTQTGKIDTTGPTQDITVPLGTTLPARATTSLSVSANLDASAAAGATVVAPVELIDSRGGSHIIKLTFTKDAAADSWSLSLATTDPTIKDPGTLTDKLSLKTLKFENGMLDPATATPIKIKGVEFTQESGIPPMPEISWDLWKTPPSGTPPSGGQSAVTQFSQVSAIGQVSQNGSPAATIMDASIADGGIVRVRYSNGAEMDIARLAVAAVRNPASLIGVGDNLFRASADTSVLPPGEALSAGTGAIVGGSLESSNVDMAQEFTELITLQRGYQASSRVITTVDELTQETLNLKR